MVGGSDHCDCNPPYLFRLSFANNNFLSGSGSLASQPVSSNNLICDLGALRLTNGAEGIDHCRYANFFSRI